MPVRKFTKKRKKKLFQTFSFMYIFLIFSECIRITSSEDAMKVYKDTFRKFKRKVVLHPNLLNYDSSESNLFIQKMNLDFFLCTAFVKETNWNSWFLAIHSCSMQKIKRNHFKNILRSVQPIFFDRHTGVLGLWTQVLDAGLSTKDSGQRTLDAGAWMLGSGCCTLEARPWTLD